ncbi:MAG: hypothetical protein V1848_00415 [Candidatus Magasanikbacteria bacterium]
MNQILRNFTHMWISLIGKVMFFNKKTYITPNGVVLCGEGCDCGEEEEECKCDDDECECEECDCK